MTPLIITLILSAAAATGAAWLATHDTGTHTAPRGRAAPTPADDAPVIPRTVTRSQPPADLFPTLAPLPPLPAMPAGRPPVAEPSPAEPERLIWVGGADTGTWQRADLDQLLEGIAA